MIRNLICSGTLPTTELIHKLIPWVVVVIYVDIGSRDLKQQMVTIFDFPQSGKNQRVKGEQKSITKTLRSFSLTFLCCSLLYCELSWDEGHSEKFAYQPINRGQNSLGQLSFANKNECSGKSHDQKD